MDSVKAWAKLNDFDYKFVDDALFEYLSDELLEKTSTQLVIASDLARLKLLQSYLKQGYETVIWCDADFLIFSPEKFMLKNTPYALGREVWIQADVKYPHKLVSYIKVHNAFMMYKKGNSFLDFYADTAERLLKRNQGSMSPQFIGPKLLTAIHNIAQCPVLESAGMLSPLVIKDLAKGHGPALELFKQRSAKPIAAANLCSSLFQQGEFNAVELEECLVQLANKTLL